MKALELAAVILNHNDNGNALRIAAVYAGISGMGRVVLADNTGAGGLAEESLPPKCELLRIPNNGYAAGNNAALRLLEADAPQFVIVSNPDVFVEPGAVLACADFLRGHPGFAIAAPRMCTADGRPNADSVWRERSFRTDLPYTCGLLSRLLTMGLQHYPESALRGEYREVDCVAGSFFVARFSMLRQAGFFDEHTFLYYEEDILCYRLKRLGCKNALLCRQRFLHCEGASVKRSYNLVRRFLAMQKSRLYFHRHYLKTPAPQYALLCAGVGLGLLWEAGKQACLRVCAPSAAD